MRTTRATTPLYAFAGLVALAWFAAPARAQFFNQTGNAFDPQIGVINSGVLNDVQAVVSPDRKYVTLNMRPTNSALLALREFSFQNPGPNATGMVGMNAGAGQATNNNAGANATGRAARAAAPAARPAALPAGPTVFDREGMTRLNAPRTPGK